MTVTRRSVVQGALATAGLASASRLLGADGGGSGPTPAPLVRAIPSTGERIPVIGIGTNAFDVETANDLAPLREVLREMPTLSFEDRCVVEHNLTRRSENLWRETDLRSWNLSRWTARQQLRQAVNGFDMAGCDLPALHNDHDRNADHDF